MSQADKEKWPRRFHLHIAQPNERADFPKFLEAVLLEDENCIVMESEPRAAGKTRKSGHFKWRHCVVRIRDALCMTAMSSRLQSNQIICRPRTYRSS